MRGPGLPEPVQEYASTAGPGSLDQDGAECAARRRAARLAAGGLTAAVAVGGVAGVFGGDVALLAVLICGFMLMALSDYRAGVLVAILLLPLSATRIMPRELFGITGFNPLNATLLMAIPPLAFMLLFQRDRVSLPRPPAIFIVYLGLVGAAAANGALHTGDIPAYFKMLQIISFSNAGGYLRDVFLKPMLILLTAFLLAIAVASARNPSTWLIPIFVSAIILPLVVQGYVAASGVPLSVLSSETSRGFLSILGMHANELGFLFNTAFALALFTFFRLDSGAAKWALGLAAVVLSAAVGLTFSRGAYLGYVSVLIYFLFMQRRFSIMLAALIVLAIAVFFMPQAVIDRATAGAGSGSMDTISTGRMDGIWRPLLPEVMHSPVAGGGLSSILWSEPARHGMILRVGHPHSAYLGALLDFGIAGSLLILLFIIHMWRLFNTIAATAPEPVWAGYFAGATACVLLLLVQGLTDERFTPTFPQTFLWLSYGIALGLMQRTETDTK